MTMVEPGRSSAVDRAFLAARQGDREAFAEWMGLVERPIRSSLRRFARVVDVEVVVQETLLRMWIVCGDARRTLEGENASLRFALRVARNVALEEVRRSRLGRQVSLEAMIPLEIPIEDPPPPDPGLARAIEDCFGRLAGRPRAALEARLEYGHQSGDRDLAAALGMALNTFLQNIVRARRALAACLEKKGVALEGLSS